MEVLYPHFAGLDVRKQTVVTCVRHISGGKVKTLARTFATMTGTLLSCRPGWRPSKSPTLQWRLADH